MYEVETIDYPWLHGVGFIVGQPVIRIQLRNGGKRKYDGHAIAERVRSASPMDRAYAQRWVAITGDTEQADNHLLLLLRHTANKLVYIESHGARSMCDATGRFPMWDHVCLRTALPADPTQIELFHSVIVDGKPTTAQLDEFEHQLGKIAYNGERYLTNTPYARALIKTHARTWRLTESIRQTA